MVIKAKVNKLVRELKVEQKALAKTRDRLYGLKSTAEELISDANDALDDLDGAIEKLSKLQ